MYCASFNEIETTLAPGSKINFNGTPFTSHGIRNNPDWLFSKLILVCEKSNDGIIKKLKMNFYTIFKIF
jgi:hypothetical protein